MALLSKKESVGGLKTYLSWQNNQNDGKNKLLCHQNDGKMYLKVVNGMKNIRYAIPEYVTSNDVKRVREKLNMSQREFANFVNVSKPTVERWEREKDKINGPIVLLLNMIENNMEYLNNMKIPTKEYPLRLFYMNHQMICTIIDVDLLEEKVKIKNYANNIMYRAFGKNDNPTFSDYEEFLKSRCFPETRDKLKLVLEDLNLPFYDPFLIIKKTEGRMAEDDFWIRIEE